MINIIIPQEAKNIIEKLQDSGYRAYVVGGCVRDSILNRPVHDWDITTSATPDEIMRVFKDHKIIETGLQHGTVTVMKNHTPYEVTTFRIDGDYSDGRHPDKVRFTDSLLEDLKRRDFTINAMAYNDEEGLIDPFDGMRDIQNKIIRCVGSPKERFSEDVLRILRALRFAARFGFNIEMNTSMEIHRQAANITKISAERIQKELLQIFDTNWVVSLMRAYTDVFISIIPELQCCVKCEQKNPYHLYYVLEHILQAIECCEENDIIVKISLLLHDIGKPHCRTVGEDGYHHFKGHGKISADLAETILRRLKFTNEMREKIVELVFYHDVIFEASEKCIKRWLNKIGEEQLRRLLIVRRCDILGQSNKERTERLRKVHTLETILDDVLSQKSCFSLKDLAISGKDLIEAGMKPGKELGIMLNSILELVIDSELPNDKDIILNFVKCQNSKE